MRELGRRGRYKNIREVRVVSIRLTPLFVCGVRIGDKGILWYNPYQTFFVGVILLCIFIAIQLLMMGVGIERTFFRAFLLSVAIKEVKSLAYIDS